MTTHFLLDAHSLRCFWNAVRVGDLRFGNDARKAVGFGILPDDGIDTVANFTVTPPGLEPGSKA